MKTALIFAAEITLLALPAQAYDRPCNPAIGNWQNAAPTTCPIHGNGGQVSDPEPVVNYSRPPEPPHECEPKGDGDETPA